MVHPDHLSSWGHHKVRPDRVAGFGDLAVSLSGVTVSGGGGDWPGLAFIFLCEGPRHRKGSNFGVSKG